MRTTKRHAPAGYTYVDKALALALFEAGYEVTMHGNNVNHYHVFEGWRLGMTVKVQEHSERLNFKEYGRLNDLRDIEVQRQIATRDSWVGCDATPFVTVPMVELSAIPYMAPSEAFDDICSNILGNLDKELGSYLVFCTLAADLTTFKQRTK